MATSVGSVSVSGSPLLRSLAIPTAVQHVRLEDAPWAIRRVLTNCKAPRAHENEIETFLAPSVRSWAITMASSIRSIGRVWLTTWDTSI